MSRRRLSPTQWLDEGPAEHVLRLGGNVQATTLGSVVPVMKSGYVLENRLRSKVPQAFSIHPENRRSVCGVPMMHKLPNWQEPTGQTCGRIVGHRDTHRSRETMTEEAARRRTGHRAVG